MRRAHGNLGLIKLDYAKSGIRLVEPNPAEMWKKEPITSTPQMAAT